MALPSPDFVFGQLSEAQRQVGVERHRVRCSCHEPISVYACDWRLFILVALALFLSVC